MVLSIEFERRDKPVRKFRIRKILCCRRWVPRYLDAVKWTRLQEAKQEESNYKIHFLDVGVGRVQRQYNY